MKRILSSTVFALLMPVSFGVANPIPLPAITEYSVDPPWIEVMEFEVEVGDTIWTAAGFFVILEVEPTQDGVAVLDSSNTTGFVLNPDNDSIIIYSPDFYGTISYGNYSSFALPPLPLESVIGGIYQRDPQNYDVAYDFCIEPTPGEWYWEQPAGGAWGSSDVVINEINLHCTWAENAGFIELYNRGGGPVDVGSLFLIGNGRIGFPESLIVPPGGFLVIDEEDFPDGFALNYGADNLYLIDNGGSVLDQVGWSSDHGQNVSFMRYPDGDCENNFMGYNDSTSFSFENGFPSRGAPNRHESPGFVIIGTRAVGGQSAVDLRWTDPIWESRFDISVAVRSETGFPEIPDDGIIIYEGDAQYAADTEDLYPGRWYYYTVFARDLSGEYSIPTYESRDSVILSGVGVIEDIELPDRISYLRSYPNPFNANTTLQYSLLQSSAIRVEIYNIVGQRVATLFEGAQQAGGHSISWDASGFPSGVYFARLEAGDYSKSQKMVLLK
jgi:hypothetical protein